MAGRQSIIKVGDVFQTNNCGRVVVMEYHDKSHVIVKFENTGYVKRTHAKSLKDGQVKNPYHPSVYGVGYLGEGVKTRIDGVVSRFYVLWKGMLARCYSQIFQNTKPSYIGCTVCDRWHNYQNFYQDIQSLPCYEIWLDPVNNYQLDKDIKFPGNKIYSPESCMFVPESVNAQDAMYRRFHT